MKHQASTTTPTQGEATPPAVRARLAASLLVLRDATAGLQVLMLRRADKPGDQNSGAAVFPGGLLDKADAGHHELCHGLDDATASARLGLTSNGLDFWIAAVRECFEEAGLLYAWDAQGAGSAQDARAALVALDAHDADALAAMRQALHANQLGMAEVCERLGVTLAMGELTYLSHWMTPAGMPKVFDTRFFVARAPERQVARHDATETVELLWLTPAEALARADELKMMNVTRMTLKALAGHADVDSAIAAARAQVQVPMIRPRLGRSPKGRHVVNPGEWSYAEIGRLDPAGRGDVGTELVPGVPVWLSPRICRVTAPNGNMMTGPGTNSYFIGVPGADAWALLDPGPDDEEHVRALLAAAPGKITRILVTHTHKDRAPAVAAIRAASGAPTFGRVAAHPEWQDRDFAPEHVLADGDRLALGEGTTLRVLHTPGHASNHLCYLLEEEKLLFTGDHLMQGSTVVINPPDGDMAHYLAALRRLLDEDLEWLAPGHGFLIDAPHEVVRRTIAHRLAREARVLAAAQAHGPADEATLLASVYADTPKHLHAVALRSLRAHLLKLRADALVRADDEGLWSA